MIPQQHLQLLLFLMKKRNRPHRDGFGEKHHLIKVLIQQPLKSQVKNKEKSMVKVIFSMSTHLSNKDLLHHVIKTSINKTVIVQVQQIILIYINMDLIHCKQIHPMIIFEHLIHLIVLGTWTLTLHRVVLV